jgi:AmmeMemoRadiSam system radical SAM enzyme/AmmeMemoRadiSam system protein B/AmmeMemoRadiSam system protein A
MKSQVANATLADVLDQHTAAGSLWHRADDRIRCVACGHRCLIGEGKRGICKVRYSEAGELRVPFGYVAGLQCDPVEKKPFFHVHPGSDALTFGMMGCDLHCSYCQNWVTSQALRDSAAVAPIREVTPAQLVGVAQREHARLVVSSYNEPLITAEWAVAVFEKAKAAGLDCAFVSNGNATPEVLDFLQPWIVAYKVDLKSFDDRHYRSLGGTLSNITDTIEMIHARGIWLEVVTLIVPGFNDSELELRRMARFLASVSRDIPWHVTAFHQDYRMTDPDATPPSTLMRAAEIGAAEGLRYIYAGNLPGQVGIWENTRCPGCRETLIERYGYLIRAYRLTAAGGCPSCGAVLPGIWPREPDSVRTGNDRAAYARRLPRAVATGGAEPTLPREVQSLSMVDRTRQVSPPTGGSAMATAVPSAPRRLATSPRPELSAEQQQYLLSAARDLVRGLASGQHGGVVDPTLGGLGGHLVAGAFISLKRGKHLRSCCGMLGQPIPLVTALQEAAARTVWEDVRFPPVSPSEIDHLHLEVWLLHSPQPVEARDQARADAVTVGKHGVQVVRGTQHGLFLPSVAIEHQWDSRRFLDQVCLKAGLHASAWQEDATALFVFEGEVLRGPLGDGATASAAGARPAGICRPEELRTLASFCCDNVGALLSGATPSHYCPGAPDGNVNGVVLTLQRPRAGAVAEYTHFCQLSLRPGVPLQSTLFTLCQSAAQAITTQALTPEMLGAMRLSVTLLSDPVLHGTALEHDLAGIDPQHRTLLVLERHKSGMAFDPARQPTELLAEAVHQARVSHPGSAAVFSLDTLGRAPFTLSTAPRAVQGPSIRPPAVAGQFYPAEAAALSGMVDNLLAGDGKAELWPAAMVPHAGLVYSGRIAADVLKRLRIPRTVIVLGPKHTALGVDWAVAPHETWTFPGGRLQSDVRLARELAEAIPGLELDAAAHQREHGVEVELPLVARLAPESRVVGIAIGAGDLPSCCRFAEGLAGVLKQREDRPLLLISSDMNHYATDTENRRLDAIALTALETLDPAKLYETVTENNISMCGVLPAVIVMETLRRLGCLQKTERVGYATSADVNGDQRRVVGYAGMLFG